MEEPVDKKILDLLTDPEALYENAPCGYLSFLPDGKVIKINRTLLDWLGYDREEVLDKTTFTDLITKGGRIYYEMFYFPLLQLQNTVSEINFEFIRKDGSRFPALINSNVIGGTNGQILAVNATVYNITDRKKYEKALLDAKKAADAERRRFELLADFIPEMIWTADSEGLLNYANKRFHSYFNTATSGNIAIHTVISKIHTKDRFKLMSSWLRAIRSAADFQAEIRLYSSTEHFQWYLVRALPTKDEQGTISKWMGSCTNINEHVNAIEKLDEFITIASHELKTPITTLKASVQLMQRFKDSEQALKVLPKLIEQTVRSVGKIDNLINDLLNTGNIKEGQMVLNKMVFNVRDFLDNSCPHVKNGGSHQLVITCDPDLKILADEHRIDQVLVNFVNNAIKYAPDSKEIFLNAKKQGEFVKFSVTDKGPGIPAEKLPYVFDRYYRVQHSGVVYSGLGLGLYICAEIVKKHGGTIGVESELGKGTSFWLTLPDGS